MMARPMMDPSRLAKEARNLRHTAARARRLIEIVRASKDKDRIRRFAKECEDRAEALENKIEARRE
jgi:hypothetical protein